MNEIPSMIQDLALILVTAGLVTLIFKKLKQPVVLGYIVAGFLVSSHMPYVMSVVNHENIETWADIGVMFTLFSLGLDFSFKKIVKMGAAPVIAAITTVFCMMGLGIVVGHLFGWKSMDCIFLGGMLAMSSTTIIYKAFDDMGLRQQKFAGLVMSVLILEDVLAIVLMVMLAAMGGGEDPSGEVMLNSILNIGFVLVLWFVVGIFLVPMFLRKCRKLLSDETLLIVSLGLCCLMAVISVLFGFSSAFGAFVMGSILAETVEADKIEHLVEPVKNLFGAIFFVSVGMLVDFQIMIDYAFPILVLVLTILIGQAIFGTFGYFISGQPLKTALKCGFSMAQIGEFSFIIASMGLTMKVISPFLYPVVVTVSVITTFLTPYMIRAAAPVYQAMEKRLPHKLITILNNITVNQRSTSQNQSKWRSLLIQLIRITVIYGILSATVIIIMFSFFLPFAQHLLPKVWANGICGVLTVILISPFLRSIVMKKNHSEEMKALWTENTLYRLPLIFTIIVRLFIAIGFVFYIVNHLTHFTHAIMICLAILAVIIMVLNRTLKARSIQMERLFVQNLKSREISAQILGKKKPLFADHLLDRDIHISFIDVPTSSLWVGMQLRDLDFGRKYGVHISSIFRAGRRLNIPAGDNFIFGGDRLQVIGSDDQLTALSQAARTEVYEPDADLEARDMHLQQIIITKNSPFLGKTLIESGIRDFYNCMVVGLEEGEENLTRVDPNRRFELDDIVWIVGEKEDLKVLL